MRPIAGNSGLRALLAAVSCVGLVILSVVVVDRPLATLAHDTFHGARVFIALTHIVDPVLPGSALGLLIAAIAATSGWRPGRIGRTLIAGCLAALLAYAVKDQLKFAFGRLWPETWVNNNPSWIGTHAYGFAPFHGGAGWGSFPSGHMAGITAPMTVVWLRAPHLRLVSAGLVGLVAIGLLGSDYHFCGDIIAGTYVGAACAVGLLAALHPDWSALEETRATNARSERRRGAD